MKNRVKELRFVRIADIVPNPVNWRTHPENQVLALSGVLDEIGIADALIGIEAEGGKVKLLDGHCRLSIYSNQPSETEVPVLILDLTEEESRLFLATFDPLAAMAGADTKILSELLDTLAVENQDVQSMLDNLLTDSLIEGGGETVAEPTEKDYRTMAFRVTSDQYAMIDSAIKHTMTKLELGRSEALFEIARKVKS